MTDKNQPPGDLNISVSSDSAFLGQRVPIEVRDSRHRLVKRTTSSTVQLPAGLYEISAVLEDGRRHSAVVDVVAGKPTPVELVADEEATAESDSNAYVSQAQQAAPPPPPAPQAPPPPQAPRAPEGGADDAIPDDASADDANAGDASPGPASPGGASPAPASPAPASPAPARPSPASPSPRPRPSSGATAAITSTVGNVLANVSRSFQQNRFTRRMYENMEGDAPTSEAAASVTFVEAHGAKLVRETRTLRIFECEPSLTEVATATFAFGNHRLVTSLPISPAGGSPAGSCAVRIEGAGRRIRARAWITPERTIANALQNMLASDYLLQAADAASSAITLLREKYDDPTGAALGALLLYKTGKLEQFESWVGNLARDFPWLPDGNIVLARSQADRGRPPIETLDKCLHAATQRPLYAECHAMLMDLLRRWPGGSRSEPGPKAEERAQAVARLSAVAPFVDTGAICFSHWVPSEEAF